MTISFTLISQYLADGSIEYVNDNQLKLNFSTLLGQDGSTLDSSAMKAVYLFLDGLADLTTAINQQRAAQTPALAPIQFVEKGLSGTVNVPQYKFTCEFNVDSSKFDNDLIDPG